MVKLLIGVFFVIDEMVYSIVKSLYTIFMFMGEVRLSADETTGAILSRIYVLIFFIMVFVLAYALLNYIINPDKVNDNNIGASSLLKKILISLGVVIISPMLFSELYYLQHLVIKSHVIENVILGGHTFKYEDGTEVEDDSVNVNYVIAAVYSSFLYPEDGSAWDCLQDGMNGTELAEDDGDMAGYCNAYYQAISTGSISGFSRYYAKDGFKYLWFISPIAGIALIFFILSFCVNLGMRVFKLLVLEILAPIPALLDLIPGKSETLKKYFETTLGVFAELFIYQAVVLGGMWLITMVPVVIPDLFTNLPGNIGIFAYMILIFAMLKVAKDLPKLISDVLGIKGDGVLKATGLRALGMAGVTAGAAAGIGSALFGRGNGNVGNRLTGAVQSLGHNLWAGRNASSLKEGWNNNKAYKDKMQEGFVNRSIKSAQRGERWDSFKKAATASGSFKLGDAYQHIKDTRQMSNAEYSKLYREQQAHSNIVGSFKDFESIYKNDTVYSSYSTKRDLLEAQINTELADQKKAYLATPGKTEADWEAIKENREKALKASKTIKVDGQDMTFGQLESIMTTQKEKVLNKNIQEVYDKAQKSRATVYANRDVDGVPQDSIDINALIKDGKIDMAELEKFESIGKKSKEHLGDMQERDDFIKFVQKTSARNEKEINKKAAQEAAASKKTDGK